jgi:hypothetical protein
MAALRLIVIGLALVRAFDGLRLTLSGLASSIGWGDGWLWLSPAISRAVADASWIGSGGRMIVVIGYLAVAWLVWRRDRRAVLAAAAVFLLDLARWAMHSASAAYSAAHISAGADGPFWLDMVDILKLSTGAAVLLGVFWLQRGSAAR